MKTKLFLLLLLVFIGGADGGIAHWDCAPGTGTTFTIDGHYNHTNPPTVTYYIKFFWKYDHLLRDSVEPYIPCQSLVGQAVFLTINERQSWKYEFTDYYCSSINDVYDFTGQMLGCEWIWHVTILAPAPGQPNSFRLFKNPFGYYKQIGPDYIWLMGPGGMIQIHKWEGN